MRSVPFQQVLHGTARLLGMNPSTDLNTARAATLTEYLNTVLKPAWQFDWWPEWMACEARYWRNAYTAGEFIEPTNERYHIGSGAYYQAVQLQPAAAQPPATFSANVWTENSAYWALCKTSYEAALQVSGEALAVGNQRKDAESGKTYQIFMAHTTASPTVDTTKAGELKPFARYLSFEQEGRTAIGTVKGVHQRDPRVFPARSGKLDHRLNHQGIIVAVSGIPQQVWVEFRLRPPLFTSTPWAQPASGHGYDLGALVYYNAGVFKSLVGNNESVLDNTEQWEYVGFPEILADYCKLAAAARALTDQKQNDRKNDLLRDAQAELERVREQEITSQQEPESVEVMTYGR